MYYDDDGYFYVTMVGTAYSLSDTVTVEVEEEPKRRFPWSRKRYVVIETPKPTFGFARVLDEKD